MDHIGDEATAEDIHALSTFPHLDHFECLLSHLPLELLGLRAFSCPVFPLPRNPHSRPEAMMDWM